jgi:hypothetical protein
MAILLAFAPFFVYLVVGRIFGVTAGLVAATSTSVALLVYDTLIKKKSAKILEMGTAVLFYRPGSVRPFCGGGMVYPCCAAAR